MVKRVQFKSITKSSNNNPSIHKQDYKPIKKMSMLKQRPNNQPVNLRKASSLNYHVNPTSYSNIYTKSVNYSDKRPTVSYGLTEFQPMQRSFQSLSHFRTIYAPVTNSFSYPTSMNKIPKIQNYNRIHNGLTL